MKNILLPTDFSNHSYNAIKYAVQLLQHEECVFYLLNTYTPALYNSEFLISTNLSLEEIYKENSERSLIHISSRIKNSFPNEKHTFKTISSFNTLNDEIKDQVEEKNIDLVVMGTQGATGAMQILLGSHTVYAIKKATCPLLAIPSNFKFQAPKNLLFATDFETKNLKNYFNWIKEIARDWNSTINVLHVLKKEPLTPLQISAKKFLTEYLQDIPHKFYTIEKESVPKGIHQFSKENSMNMLVMIRHKHSFFENLFFRSVTDSIGFQLVIPFLVIPSAHNIKN